MALAEAWPGRARSNRGNPIHVVDWPRGRDSGHALCGRELSWVQVFADGWARHVGVKRCGLCEQRREERLHPQVEVIQLSAATPRRRR